MAILGCTGLGFYASRVGEFRVWSELLDRLDLSGDEQILAIGVDLWRRGDQTGNAAEPTKSNAVADGVADRVAVRTADMTALPFESASFDVIVSSVAIHNVDRLNRDKAIEEAVRVLRPGGRLMIADLLATRQYYGRLKHLGMANVDRTNLGWRMWWTGPWLSTHPVAASKPN